MQLEFSRNYLRREWIECSVRGFEGCIGFEPREYVIQLYPFKPMVIFTYNLSFNCKVQDSETCRSAP